MPAAGPDDDIRVSYISNDDGPVSSRNSQVKRPQRISSLFAGFEGGSSDEGEYLDGFSDQEYRTALAPRPKTGGRTGGGNRYSIPDRPVPESPSVAPSKASNRYSRQSKVPTAGYAAYVDAEVARRPDLDSVDMELSRGLHRRLPRTAMLGSVKQNAMRKAAMIQSGIASHSRAFSPADSHEVQEPPFPIPTRASSRQPVLSASVPGDASGGAREEA